MYFYPDYSYYLAMAEDGSCRYVLRGWVIAHLGEIENVKFTGTKLLCSDVLSVQQISFFKNSQIRDSKGDLLVCYHASKAAKRFSVFGNIKKYPGFWFTEDKKYAETHGDMLYVCYLNIQRVLDLENTESERYLLEFVKKYHKANSLVGINLDDVIFSKEFREYLIRKGFDGLIWRHDEAYTIVALYPNQIKAVANRHPTNSDDIYN